MQRHRTRRRRLLRLSGLAATVVLAGCGGAGSDGGDDGGSDDGGGGGYGGGGSEDSDDGDEGTDTTSTGADSGEGGGGSTDGETATLSATPGTDELDLREANVVGVAFEGGDGTYDFDVTLHHDDDGEEGYANWWQVERLDGTRLGRRELTHPHSRQPFTRSASVDVPGDVSCVVVRGHDQTHGYGGRAVLVNLESGQTRGVMQGPEPRAFAAEDCP